MPHQKSAAGTSCEIDAYLLGLVREGSSMDAGFPSYVVPDRIIERVFYHALYGARTGGGPDRGLDKAELSDRCVLIDGICCGIVITAFNSRDVFSFSR